MKYLILLIVCVTPLLPTVAKAQTFTPPPFVFAPGTFANASQMMANYQAFVSNGNSVSIDLANRIAAKQPFPSGTIAFFNLCSCPVDWTLKNYGTRFIRGLDLGRGKDPGNTLGQLEASQNQGHKHSVTSAVGKTSVVFATPKGNAFAGPFALLNKVTDAAFNAVVDSGSHGTEVRPHAMSLIICRKD